ncbi:unconventional myosin-XVIIIa isoform X1 [Xyrauchen texanus]|uniref:unconventional myosin-XVIIIa isoform X1 n=1 Tax=Xyrauchen texanus TaxID=154827 RepID=UPI002242915B|nr:unconventional myosin-XVIIIa isoform X1 [Xyrauchen texanus]XP_051973112.1 unconventional myosin-XVIIIa isoform X1 [Xyrauchen texanus]XP_051973113.1 unconventional myosin-XVIIIa isoform X1 [Xyrauchen texanus]XP_051973114.1 unconventional myosin-XVIIIa isoform X1 [Xyrauchen texanus]XP_051973115.1 unconventional myosin-XVIIIa isoform X1 [Xyrauchen texanus]
MAFSSRFSFWEKKVKDENVPGAKGSSSDSENSPSQTAVSGATDQRSVAPNQERSPIEDQQSNRCMNGRHGGVESDSLARTGMNAAQRVTPKMGSVEQASSSTSVPKSSPLQTGRSKDRDDLSAGLTSLMGRARTKEHRSRSRAAEHKETPKQVKESQISSEEAKEETQTSVPNSASSSPASKVDPLAPPSGFIPPAKPNPLAPPTGFILAPKPNPSTQLASKPDPLAPPAGFIPSPKPNPLTQLTSKLDPLAPPAGFIPSPKPNPLTQLTSKSDPLAPPNGFIPAPKSNPTSQPPSKPDPLAPPMGFVPTPKRDPFAPVSGFIPKPKVDPLAPPAGFIPVPRTTAVRKPEVKGVSKPSAAPAGKLPSQSAFVDNQQGSPLMPISENHKHLEQNFTAKAAEDPVALLQVAHESASLSKVKTEEQLAAEKAWYNTEKVWLVHKDGFSLATQLKMDPGSLPEGKVKVRLEHDGTLLEVDEEDVEKANPLSYDRVEDLSSLLYLNESSILHTLRQRFGGNLIHTYAGSNLLVINPLSFPAMYSEKVMQMFKGCRREETAPHVFAIAQSAYRQLLTTRQDQTIVLLGRSGSGKTTNSQHLLQYLVTIAAGSGKVYSAEKWQAVYTVLEAFGNCSTVMNGNASRFSHIVSLDFDQAGQVASASVQTMLLEKFRVTRRPEAESSFNVFYYLMAGADASLKTELHFNHFAENSAFGLFPPSKPEDKQKAAQQFAKLQAAMKVLGISGEEQKTVWLILGAIYHLGAAGATKAGRKQFARHEWAQKASYLLGCTLEELSSAIFRLQGKGSLPRSASVRQSTDDTDSLASKATAAECLESMASSLYSELFTLLISLINRALKSSQHSLCSLMIVDTPGFQNPRQVKNQRGATFEELCHNYGQERLQTLFQERTFVQELERYKEENIEITLDDLEPSPSRSLAVIDQSSSQALVRTLSRTDEARGLFWLMEEEVLQPGGSEDTLLQRLFNYYGPAEGESKGHTVLVKSENTHNFLLGHSHGTDWVEYDTNGWLNLAKLNPTPQNAANLLANSQKKSISGLFVGRSSSAAVLSGSIAGLEGVSQLAMRRATGMRKTFTTGMAAVKKKSLCLQIKLQVDALLDTVRRSRVHFVHCLLPRAEALRTAGSPEAPGEICDPGLMQLDVALLRAQVRGFKLLDSLRIYRQGFPDHMVFSEFRRRFDVLAPHLTKKLGRNYIVKDEKRAVEELLESLELEKSSYHMGLSRVFFRAGTVAKLEGQRDEYTRQNITLFQAACRGYLSRQAFKKRKIQDLAIRCLQKNIKKNHGVKDWPWWKLFTTVRPLVEVQLTEEQIRGKDEEIMYLKLKMEKVEKERNELRLTSDRLESRITELTAELSDERNSAESTSQLLETETSERLRLEKDMKDMQVKFVAVKKQMESMEMEIMEARLLQASELNVDMDNDDDDDSGGEWRLKYERAIRDTEFTKKKLQQELDDKLETEQQNKRHLERKLADLQADQEESQRSIQQLKKKCQRLGAELQDTKLHLENQEGRNHELERKQRKFDVEQNQVHEELQRERNQREKLARERDMLSGEIFTIRQQIQEKETEQCAVSLKLEQLESELQDLSSQESKDEASHAKIKKQLRDLDAKVKDQEEELDEQAGTIQMLEQAKLRLEMEMERQKQTHSKELEGKDEEVEEIRLSCSKKLKQMEVQLEEEYEDKQRVLREKRDLESKLMTAQEQVGQKDVETEKRLRKDLKRTKVLLADAQIMLDHLKSNVPSKREISILKNKLEESEFACAAAVKARKSMELEIEDLHIQMDDITKSKMSLEEQVSRLQREKNDLQSRFEEDQEDMNELLKKHKAAVAQSTRDLAQLSDLQTQLEEAMKEKQEIQDKLHSLQSHLEFQEQSMVEKSLVSRQEAKIRELETKLEYERTQTKRLESLVTRLKENLEKMTEERDQRVTSENREKDQNKRMQRQIRDIKEEMTELSKKEAEASRKKHELVMDIESLEAANQSLQADLKLAFKRIGDLQAAMEDEMETDDDEDLISSLQDMVTKYQKRKNKTGNESDMDSEVEDRVDGVKSLLSKSKGSTKTLTDEGSLKTPRHPNAANADVKDMKEGREGKEGKNEVRKESDESRPVSAMSSLSYRKRSHLKDWNGGTGDESSLFSALREQPDMPDRASLRKARNKSTDGPQIGDDPDDRGSVISQAYSEATSRARKGLDRRWTKSSPEFDKESTVSSVAPSRASTHRGLDQDDDARSGVSSFSLRRSTSWMDDNRSDYEPVGTSQRSRSRSPGNTSISSRISLARSTRLSEFGVRLNDNDNDDDVDSVSVAAYSPRLHGRSLSTPAQLRSSENPLDASDVKPVSHRNYLDPELEKAINEVLSFKPIKFKRRSLEDSDEEEGGVKVGENEDRKSVKSLLHEKDNEDLGRSGSSLRRSASGSAVDYGRCGSSLSSLSSKSSSSKKKKKKKSRRSESDSSSNEGHARRRSRQKDKKGSRRKSEPQESGSSKSESDSESSSSSASTISYRSSNSVKRAAAQKASDGDQECPSEERPPSKKEVKKQKKKVDSLVMKYLYKPDSD